MSNVSLALYVLTILMSVFINFIQNDLVFSEVKIPTMKLLLLAFVILTLFKGNIGDNETTLIDEIFDTKTTTEEVVVGNTEEILAVRNPESTTGCSSCAAISETEDPSLTTKLSNVSLFQLDFIWFPSHGNCCIEKY